jgi:hypothetical protein
MNMAYVAKMRVRMGDRVFMPGETLEVKDARKARRLILIDAIAPEEAEPGTPEEPAGAAAMAVSSAPGIPDGIAVMGSAAEEAPDISDVSATEGVVEETPKKAGRKKRG